MGKISKDKPGEKFDRNKLEKELKEAGIPEGVAKKTADAVAGRIKGGDVTELGEMVIHEMRGFDETAARLYNEIYSKKWLKTKD